MKQNTVLQNKLLPDYRNNCNQQLNIKTRFTNTKTVSWPMIESLDLKFFIYKNRRQAAKIKVCNFLVGHPFIDFFYFISLKRQKKNRIFPSCYIFYLSHQ